MNDYVEIHHIVNLFRKWWWMFILAIIVSTGIGYEVGQRQTPIYEAKTTILVGDIIQAAELERTDILTSQLVASTYVDIIRSQPIMAGVVDSLELDWSWQNLKKIVNAQLVEGTQIIQIFVESSSPTLAQVIADETARQTILYSPNDLQNSESEDNRIFVRQQLNSLQNRLEAGQIRLATLESELASTTSTDRLIELQNEATAMESLITEWESNYTQLLVFLDSKQSPTTLTVIESAQVSSTPIRPKIRLYVLIAGGVGLVLALGLVLLLEYLDDTIKSFEELNKVFNLVPLGSIPKIKGRSHETKLRNLQDQLSLTTEAFRLIGGNLKLYSLDGIQKSLLITSPNQSEGKSLIISSLGIVLANTGLATIIVDANLRDPSIHKIFKLNNKKGLMDLLSREKYDIGEYLHKSDYENLKLMPIGNAEINPSNLLMQNKVDKIIDILKDHADVVLFDSSSVLDHADTKFLSTQMDGVILVVAAKRTKTYQVGKSIQNLEQAEASLSGIIFNEYLPGKPAQLLTKLRSFVKDRSSRESIRHETSLNGRTLLSKLSLKRQ